MPLSSFLVESTLPPCRGQRREGFSSPLSMLLDRGGFTSQRACAGEFDGAGPKEDLANRRRERERQGQEQSLVSSSETPVGSSWPVNIFKGGLKPAWLNSLLALVLSRSKSRAAPNPSRAHAAQLLGWCSNYWTGWCR